LELIGTSPAFLLDGAHNVAGARTLQSFLEEFAARPLTIIFGTMRDKRIEDIAEVIFPLADQLILTPIQNPRSASLERLNQTAKKFDRGQIKNVATCNYARHKNDSKVWNDLRYWIPLLNRRNTKCDYKSF
jgi:folylpolyglutamate synthase/dihydropteroate synthase